MIAHFLRRDDGATAQLVRVLGPDPDQPGARRARGEMVAGLDEPTVLDVLVNLGPIDDLAESGPGWMLTGRFPGERIGDDGRRVSWRRAELETVSGLRLPDAIEWDGDHPAARLATVARLERAEHRTTRFDDVRQALADLGVSSIEVVPAECAGWVVYVGVGGRILRLGAGFVAGHGPDPSRMSPVTHLRNNDV